MCGGGLPIEIGSQVITMSGCMVMQIGLGGNSFPDFVGGRKGLEEIQAIYGEYPLSIEERLGVGEWLFSG